jgi:hypothetical protein
MSEKYSFWYCHNCDSCGHPVEGITGELPGTTFTVWPTVDEWEEKTGLSLNNEDLVWFKSNSSLWTSRRFLFTKIFEIKLVLVAIPGLGRPTADWRPGMPYPKEETNEK